MTAIAHEIPRLRLKRALLSTALVLSATTAQAEDPCQAIARQTDATTIAYGLASRFAICRGGHAEPDVVVGRPVYVEVVPGPGVGLYRFRVRGRGRTSEPTGLRAVGERMRRLHGALHTLGSSGESIAEASAGAAPSGAVDQSRMLYLGVATTRFHEALASTAAALESLAYDVTLLSQWCAEVAPTGDPSALITAELRRRCGDAQVAPAVVAREGLQLAHAIDAYGSARDGAREALVSSRARPDDGSSQQKAVSFLDDARRRALDVMQRAQTLDRIADALAGEAELVRQVVREAPGALTPGVPQYLTRFGRGGSVALQIDITPVDLATGEGDDPRGEREAESSQTFQFPVVSLHFLDIEAGLAATGAPQVPVVGPQGQIVGQNVDEFVGLALVELEPARFLWPDRSLAGLFRFPVVGIPFTRDPTRNFFAGVGVGWTGIGSVSAGPYLLRELALDSGRSFGDTVPKGVSLDAVASPALRVGYFVSASVDLVGLAHLFFTPREPQLDATTGTEAAAGPR